RQVEERDGKLVELTELTLAKRAAKREQGQCRSLQDLQAYGKRMGWNPGRAWHVWRGRMAKQLKLDCAAK
ncbi:MAG: hypothetical protein ACRD1F_09525, partial [Terriglobales bacterium]